MELLQKYRDEMTKAGFFNIRTESREVLGQEVVLILADYNTTLTGFNATFYGCPSVQYSDYGGTHLLDLDGEDLTTFDQVADAWETYCEAAYDRANESRYSD